MVATAFNDHYQQFKHRIQAWSGKFALLFLPPQTSYLAGDRSRRRSPGKISHYGVFMPYFCLRIFVITTAILASTLAPTAQAETQPASTTATEMQPTQTILEHIVYSKILGRDVRLLVWKPKQDAPAGGYPVIYSFDGETSITVFAEFAGQAAMLGKRYGLVPPMIVGFAEIPGGYTMERRTRDYTPYADHYELNERPNGFEWPELGGGDTYLDAVMSEFKPLINAQYDVDQTRETLFGHSLAGMMTLHALATRPDAFDAYVAVSPSLWFNSPQRFDEMTALLSNPDFAPKAPVPLIMTVGSKESGLSNWDSRLSEEDLEQRLIWKKMNAMVENTEKMAALIMEQGKGKIDLDFAVLDRENHHTAKPITMSRAIEMAMTPR